MEWLRSHSPYHQLKSLWDPARCATAAHLIMVSIPLGVLIGAAVAAYDYIVNTVVWNTLSSQLTREVSCILPLFGMILTGAILKAFKVSSTAMADDIVKMYHVKKAQISLGGVVPKLFASIATMGLGCSAGMEGASKWLGGMIAGNIQSFVNRTTKFKVFHGVVKTTMLAGAAAGISAIFRAPLTGAIMGVESPYKKDLAHETLIHALVASAASYATFTYLRDSSTYFPIRFSYKLDFGDLWKCIFVGLGAGILSHLFLLVLHCSRRWARALQDYRIPLLAYMVGGLILSLIAYGLFLWIGEPATLQAGLPVARRLLSGECVLSICLIILVAKILATAVTFGMGGVGGLFLPSATIGAAYGACCDLLLSPSQPGLFTLIGVAAFTGASYNSLLFSVVFIAEASGNPSLVVPGLIATSFAYLAAEGVSNASSQISARA